MYVGKLGSMLRLLVWLYMKNACGVVLGCSPLGPIDLDPDGVTRSRAIASDSCFRLHRLKDPDSCI